MTPVASPIAVLGVPTSAGAFAPGQEGAPAALRDAGLLDALRAAGRDVSDAGDRPVWRWRPDRDHPRAQNQSAVCEIVSETAERVRKAAAGAGAVTLVLGGDCTVGIGTVAGHAALGERVGVVYLDMHADLNVPESTIEGAFDWMGMAHMLGVAGAVPELASIAGAPPLLTADRVVVVGWQESEATAFERRTIDDLGLEIVDVDAVRADPVAASARALAVLEPSCDRLVVHFDVDLIDFCDVPLSQNDGRNRGVTFDAALAALAALCASPRLTGVTVTECNPDHAIAVPGSIERLAAALAEALRRNG